MELVDALTKAGRSAEGHALLDEFATRSSELGNFAPEFLRLRGELLLLPTSAVNVATPEELFRHALSVAREQGALMFELRAATSLTRLLRDQGRHAEALSCLSPVYAQFTEGFSTADLIWAREVLESLA
jgi:predicted ATPase